MYKFIQYSGCGDGPPEVSNGWRHILHVGFERHLQVSLYVEAKQILEKLDPTVQPTLFLVGILDSEKPKHFPACVVPDDETFTHAAFLGVKEIAKRMEKSDPAQEVFYGDSRSSEQQHEGIRRRDHERHPPDRREPFE